MSMEQQQQQQQQQQYFSRIARRMESKLALIGSGSESPS
jgi:hypothetical protein